MGESDIVDLVNEFADSIIKQNQAICSETTKEVKHHGDRIAPAARKLLRMGDEAKREFATLFHHPDREVRANAAYYLLSSKPDEALAVLKELAEGDDLVALGAQLRIKEWEEHPEHYDESNWA